VNHHRNQGKTFDRWPVVAVIHRLSEFESSGRSTAKDYPAEPLACGTPGTHLLAQPNTGRHRFGPKNDIAGTARFLSSPAKPSCGADRGKSCIASLTSENTLTGPVPPAENESYSDCSSQSFLDPPHQHCDDTGRNAVQNRPVLQLATRGASTDLVMRRVADGGRDIADTSLRV